VVARIEDGADAARVTVDGRTISADWIFDSLLSLPNRKADPIHYQYLKLHFKGWEVETAQEAFNARAATFLDFRTPQHESPRFFYILPLSERRALIEYTLFSEARLSQAAYRQALKDYLETTLGITGYRILHEESGVMLVTDQPFPRRTGRRVMIIGAKGGRVKPTTGFAFTRIQQDSAAIVQSLLQSGHPFNVLADSRRYRLYDSLMLQLMARYGGEIKPIFMTMFQHNPIERIFGFLDEAAPWWENLLLIRTLPPRLFVQALVHSTRARSL
jgi:lycopene beta-cyclase